MKKQVISLFLALVLSAPAVFTLSACTPVMATRGNLLTNSELQKIQVDKSTRADVVAAIGSIDIVLGEVDR